MASSGGVTSQAHEFIFQWVEQEQHQTLDLDLSIKDDRSQQRPYLALRTRINVLEKSSPEADVDQKARNVWLFILPGHVKNLDVQDDDNGRSVLLRFHMTQPSQLVVPVNFINVVASSRDRWTTIISLARMTTFAVEFNATNRAQLLSDLIGFASTGHTLCPPLAPLYGGTGGKHYSPPPAYESAPALEQTPTIPCNKRPRADTDSDILPEAKKLQQCNVSTSCTGPSKDKALTDRQEPLPSVYSQQATNRPSQHRLDGDSQLRELLDHVKSEILQVVDDKMKEMDDKVRKMDARMQELDEEFDEIFEAHRRKIARTRHLLRQHEERCGYEIENLIQQHDEECGRRDRIQLRRHEDQCERDLGILKSEMETAMWCQFEDQEDRLRDRLEDQLEDSLSIAVWDRIVSRINGSSP